MSIVDEIKQHADQIELLGVNFLDKDGKIAKKPEQHTHVKLMFIDGKDFTCSMCEFKEFDNYQFKLRPSRNNS